MVKISEELKNEMLEGDWVIHIKDESEFKFVAQILIDSGFGFYVSGKNLPYYENHIAIYSMAVDYCQDIFRARENDIQYLKSFKNLTSKFFNEINNQESNHDESSDDSTYTITLTNQKEIMLHKCLQALIQGEIIDRQKSDGTWESTANRYRIEVDSVYRIRPKPVIDTPIILHDEVWKILPYDFVAMDENNVVFNYVKKPSKNFSTGKFVSESCNYTRLDSFKINTEGIIWNKSLTQRPEHLRNN